MESSSRYNRALSLQPLSSILMKQGKSGYEPSDTETDWLESPSRDHTANNGVLDYSYDQGTELDSDLPGKNRTPGPIIFNGRHVSKVENNNLSASASTLSQARRRNNSKSPFKPRMEGGSNLSPTRRNNISPFSKSDRRRHISSNKPVGRGEHDLGDDNANDDEFVTGKQSRKTPSRDEKEVNSQFPEIIRVTEKPIYNRRSMTAPRTRASDHTDQENNRVAAEQRERKPSPLSRNITWKQREAASQRKAPTVSEINEMVASVKISKSPPSNALKFESTDSIGDIFFSRDVFPNNRGVQGDLVYPRPVIFSQQGDSSSHHQSRSNSSSIDQKTQRPARPVPMTANLVNRQSNDRFSLESSKISYKSGKSSASAKKFAANRQRSQSDAWFSCMRKGSCRKSKSSPEKRAFDEASFIEKSLVVEKLRQFWADKHQPNSLNGFLCHKNEAQFLKELVSFEDCPHILLKGPSGSGKRSLAMALLREIYGHPCWNTSHDVRYFPVQDKRPTQALVPLTSSAHHVELNVNLEANAKYALMGLVKEIKDDYAITPEVSNGNINTVYKVIVLYEVDQAAENIQHLIKWIMDGYTDACKLILCCEDDVDILESVKNRCKVIKVDAPVTHEIMEVLIQIARKEDFDLSMSFAAKIATKSKQNLRKAIMALEACKEVNYPFTDDQPIPIGWEEVLIELAAEILADPSPKRLFVVRGKIQKLLLDFVHPKLILLKLVEQFLKGVKPSLKREIYYWHAYYDKRLPTGTSALLKLEEFVAKFMSICRKSSCNRQFV